MFHITQTHKLIVHDKILLSELIFSALTLSSTLLYVLRPTDDETSFLFRGDFMWILSSVKLTVIFCSWYVKLGDRKKENPIFLIHNRGWKLKTNEEEEEAMQSF